MAGVCAVERLLVELGAGTGTGLAGSIDWSTAGGEDSLGVKGEAWPATSTSVNSNVICVDKINVTSYFPVTLIITNDLITITSPKYIDNLTLNATNPNEK